MIGNLKVSLSDDGRIADREIKQNTERNQTLQPQSSVNEVESLPAMPDPDPIPQLSSPISVSKTLAALTSIPSNRCCAECRFQLVDFSKIYASFSPSLVDASFTFQRGQSGMVDFTLNHQVFAPPSSPDVKVIINRSRLDPAVAVTEVLGGFGVFICEYCADAHRSLGRSLCTVKAVKDLSIWSVDELKRLSQAGGNLVSWKTYEGFIPDTWKQKRPTNKSNENERTMFVRAKYDALAFLTPPGGSIAGHSWQRILDIHPKVDRWVTDELRNFSQLALPSAESPGNLTSSTTDDELPNRLLDFFCVIGHDEQLFTGEVKKDLSTVTCPSELLLQFKIIDCYPPQDTYPEMDFPTHISHFAFPDGCKASESQKAPTFFSFVLTSSKGHKLYCGALHLYEDTMEVTAIKDILRKSGYSQRLPSWLEDLNETTNSDHNHQPRFASRRTPHSEVLFMPKCLVLVSHYPFFQLWRTFLLQLNRVSMVAAPLPIERYISNFVCEVPLPPQGKVKIKYGLLSDGTITICRPPPNELPMVDFSYRPIFTSLSVGNIIVVLGLLLQETKVCICSKYYSLLTPVAEALISLLFPFEWQGLYVPVLSFPSMIDLLDAPVPFLIGLSSTYLSEVQAEVRPRGVVFVDLDRDIVHLGVIEEVPGQLHEQTSRTTPALPDRDSMKLKLKLDECGGTIYITPASGIKGMLTSGNGQLLPNVSREPYAYMEINTDQKGSNKRLEILVRSENAYHDSQNMESIHSFSCEHGHQRHNVEQPQKVSVSSPTITEKLRQKGGKVLQGFRKDTLSLSNDHDLVKRPTTLFSLEDSDSFSAMEIRAAFLRFFTSIFNRYEKFVVKTGDDAPFRSEAFLQDLILSPNNRDYVDSILKTQMFNTFLQERAENSNHDDILVFDESIIAKNNRSKVGTLVKGGKMPTPFLSDKESWKITETFYPAPPSNWGLKEGESYTYGRFPKLRSELFGNPRPCKIWPNNTNLERRRFGAKKKMLSRRLEMIKRSVSGASFNSTPALFATSAHELVGLRTLEWAIYVLAIHPWEQGGTNNERFETFSNSTGEYLTSRRKDSSGLRLPIEKETEKHLFDCIQYAQGMLLASRRKQGILLLLIVKIQASWRMYVEKCSYRQYRQALVIVEGRNDFMSSVDPGSRTSINTSRRNANVRKLFLATITIQHFIRAALKAKNQRLLRVALLGQSLWRGKRARTYFVSLRNATIKAQAIIRGRRITFCFALLKTELARIQALIRGIHSRRKVFSVVQRRNERYRIQVFTLWQREGTPLSYRSKLWPHLCKAGFLSLRLLTLELERLMDSLKIRFQVTPSSQADDKLVLEGQALGCCCLSERKYLGVNDLVDRAGRCSDNASVWFPGESEGFVRGCHTRMLAERLQIYDRLDNTVDKKMLSDIYAMYFIKPDDKKKKARILQALWADSAHASRSAKTLVLLFPELETDSDIKAINLSRNTLRKFGKENAVLRQLDKSLLVGPKLNKLMRDNVVSVTVACLSSVLNLTIQLHEAEKTRIAAFDKWKNAIQAANHFITWRECQQKVIRDMLC